MRTACLVGAIMQANRVFYATNCVRGVGPGGRATYVPWYAPGEENLHSSLLTLFSALYEDLTFFPRLALDVRGNFPHNKN